jgi:hypothetical protein
VSQLGLFDAPPAPAVRPLRPAELLVTKIGGRPEVVYRHPGDYALAWTGRGKPPRWITDWIQGGQSLEALRVSEACP